MVPPRHFEINRYVKKGGTETSRGQKTGIPKESDQTNLSSFKQMPLTSTIPDKQKLSLVITKHFEININTFQYVVEKVETRDCRFLHFAAVLSSLRRFLTPRRGHLHAALLFGIRRDFQRAEATKAGRQMDCFTGHWI